MESYSVLLQEHMKCKYEGQYLPSVAHWLELSGVQVVLHCSHCAAGCGHPQLMAHIPGQFWLVPKAWEVHGVPFVLLATQPETGLVYRLEVID